MALKFLLSFLVSIIFFISGEHYANEGGYKNIRDLFLIVIVLDLMGIMGSLIWLIWEKL